MKVVKVHASRLAGTRKLRTNGVMQLSSLSKGKLAYTFDMMNSGIDDMMVERRGMA